MEGKKISKLVCAKNPKSMYSNYFGEDMQQLWDHFCNQSARLNLDEEITIANMMVAEVLEKLKGFGNSEVLAKRQSELKAGVLNARRRGDAAAAAKYLDELFETIDKQSMRSHLKRELKDAISIKAELLKNEEDRKASAGLLISAGQHLLIVHALIYNMKTILQRLGEGKIGVDDASSEFRRVMLNTPVLFSNNEQEAEWERWAGEKDGAGLPAVATVNSPDDDGRVGRKGNGKGADGVQ